jgi:hypothetical protein
MIPSELIFCVHDLREMERGQSDPCGSSYDGVNIITFCPTSYWKENDCLPDYYFADQIDDTLLPKGYQWHLYVEECQWVSKKSKEEICKELINLGFNHSLAMETFYSECFG